jgi:hypothetical protein
MMAFWRDYDLDVGIYIDGELMDVLATRRG